MLNRKIQMRKSMDVCPLSESGTRRSRRRNDTWEKNKIATIDKGNGIHVCFGLKFKKKELYSEGQIKEWVNNQRESGKKRTFEGEPFQFDTLELVEQDYKKRRANGGRSSSSWLHHGTHLYGTHTPSRGTDDWSWEAIQDCDHKQQREAIFPKHSSVYYDSLWY